MSGEPIRNDEEWRRRLTPEQYRVCREKGTELPYSGKYLDFKGDGTYCCVCCGSELFSSDAKFDSRTGWPSFWTPFREGAVRTRVDRSWSMVRTEVHCAACDAHLGHVFEDGPEPTGLRYCTNSVALDFAPADDGAADDGAADDGAA